MADVLLSSKDNKGYGATEDLHTAKDGLQYDELVVDGHVENTEKKKKPSQTKYDEGKYQWFVTVKHFSARELQRECWYTEAIWLLDISTYFQHSLTGSYKPI